MTALTHFEAAQVSEDARATRRRIQTEAWRRRSRLIRRLRLILPASIGAILLLMAGSVILKGLISGLGDGHSGGAAIHMTNAHFQGRDGDGRAYQMGALEVARDSADSRRLHLTRPFLVFNAEDLKPTRIIADTGLYQDDTHMLSLRGHVVATDGEGDTFRTEQAVIDTLHLVVNGWNKVRGSGPHGRIVANAFGIYDHGQTVVFTGDVHSVLKRD